MNHMADEHVNVHKADMFDSIRDLFKELTALARVGREALEAQVREDRIRKGRT